MAFLLLVLLALLVSLWTLFTELNYTRLDKNVKVASNRAGLLSVCRFVCSFYVPFYLFLARFLISRFVLRLLFDYLIYALFFLSFLFLLRRDSVVQGVL